MRTAMRQLQLTARAYHPVLDNCRFSGVRGDHPAEPDGGAAVQAEAGFNINLASEIFSLVLSLQEALH
jgi:hypothetical protein